MDISTSAAEIEATPSTGANFVDRPLSALEARIARASRAVLLALSVAVGLAVIAAAGLGTNSADSASSEGSRLGGDFPAFYAAGSIVRSGDIDSLYDPARQLVEQSELGLDGYLAFAYPPHVAVAYAPLSALPFRYAYLVHTVLMAVAFAVALHVLSVPVHPMKWQAKAVRLKLSLSRRMLNTKRSREVLRDLKIRCEQANFRTGGTSWR